jgi:hypothetical protein
MRTVISIPVPPDAPSVAATTVDTPATPELAVVVVGGLLALFVARPLLNRTGDPTMMLIVLFSALLVAGRWWSVPSEPKAYSGVTVAIFAAGAAAFALGRLMGGGHAPAPISPRAVALVTLAALAEEAFFRRLVYALLRPGGVMLAVLGSASLFAVAHVTVYGWWVLPLDLAAGLLLSWQRAASGSWRVPAVTHVLANLLVLL